LSIGSVLERLFLKNAAECISQRLKWTFFESYFRENHDFRILEGYGSERGFPNLYFREKSRPVF